YPSRGSLVADFVPSPRDLAPAIYADGRIYAAPLDTDRVFCLDAMSGRAIWEADGVEIVHLLGATPRRLLAATRNGMISLEATSGLTEWTQPSQGRLPSLGRGLIAEGTVYWPMQDLTCRALAMNPESQLLSYLPLPVGNMAFGEGCL